MWNKELYVREQQDAYEFFTSLIDQMDEYLKVMKVSVALWLLQL
jgi:ubiquitin carboxyl-terminal hydrolase 9/24